MVLFLKEAITMVRYIFNGSNAININEFLFLNIPLLKTPKMNKNKKNSSNRNSKNDNNKNGLDK